MLRLSVSVKTKWYAVAKLKDGKCWMIQNLRLGGDAPIILNSSSSDVSKDFTLPASSQVGSTDIGQANINAPGYGSNYGNYYNWTAATTNNYTDGSYTLYSVCPKNWGLPTQSDFEALIKNYDEVSILQPPANFTILGSIDTSSLFDVPNYGRYWAAASYNSSLTYGWILRLSENGAGLEAAHEHHRRI